ncbi:MAG: glucosaminidase domain-containing protein [Bacteroidales bacterium]|nr:glucosaminidase domain-containing protein [Bacteroidales bacterium]
MKRILFFGILIYLSVAVNAQSVQENYIKTYCGIAVSEMARTGVPASITLAQGILESASGTSQLALKANNHFGIKCHSNWTGPKTYQDDDAKNECFRVYGNAQESFRDHSDFLRGNQRYASLFNLEITDYKSWANGLKKAGYATSPTYATRLIEIIENYGLAKYDKESNLSLLTAENNVPQSVVVKDDAQTEERKPLRYYTSNGFELSMTEYTLGSNNNTQYITMNYATDLPTLTRKLGMAPWQLSKYNDLPKNAKVAAGEVIYTKPKRNKAASKYSVHVVAEGETMRDISQKYAVKIKQLYKLNGWEAGVEPVSGSKVKLR